MDKKMILSLCVSFLLVLCSSNVRGQTKVFKVTDFGAKGNGKTDNSVAFLKAWKEACTTNGGLVQVPHGTFLVKRASFIGPCNGATFFQVDGTLIAVAGPSHHDEFWIEFREIDGLKILGSGTFNGQGPSAWPYNKCSTSSKCKILPYSIKVVNLKNSVIRGIKSVNSKGFHLHVAWCENLVVRNIKAIAPDNSPNTDGIHIGKSNNIKILNSRISTGDDCVSVGDGCSNINITGVHCGPGHGISIGSLGRYKDEENVRGVKVRNCTFTNTDNGLRIKTMAPSSIPLTVSDVTFSDIVVKNVKNPIIIDQFYCPGSHCIPSGQSGVAIKRVKFINIKGTSLTKVGVSLQCSQLRPCQNILLSGIDLKMAGTGQPTTAMCANANNSFVGKKQIPAHC